ncbi:response regulator transcription factor [Gorillibacterium sp. sgz5001074]|uniref:response regulator transcription factor n=1 Tax=Gorillibacterium sp. sgz5001074 TaxID=3446695 RepID=UPI003F670DC0
MYKVMLVDDDYPVLEYLSESIPWEELGLQLQGIYENGAVAHEAALREVPDILVTDIGMPKMNGLELIRLVKQLNPILRTVILSCHSDFQYAQQAVRLNVQEYILKETLDPGDLERLLEKFKTALDQERSLNVEARRLEHLVLQNKGAMKERFIRGTVHQPMLDPEAWKTEARTFGLDTGEMLYLPVIGYLDQYRSAKRRFVSDDMLHFALGNVVEEVLRDEEPETIHFPYGVKLSFFIRTFPDTLKVNRYDETAALMYRIRDAVGASIRVSMSFLIGHICRSPEELKQELSSLLAGSSQRFYLKPGSVVKKEPGMAVNREDPFAVYNQAGEEFRDMIVDNRAGSLVSTVNRWMTHMEEKRYPPEQVKDWTLKLLLDLKLKLQSMQYFRASYTVDILHKEIVEIDTLHELKSWLIEHFESAVTAVGELSGQTSRVEVLDAKQYIAGHLDKRISLEEVAEFLHLNPSYFSRLFKKETGETFIEYVTKMKMEKAKEYLDQTGHSVGRICELLGYDNQSYFIKTFKSITGVTPVEYRGK